MTKRVKKYVAAAALAGSLGGGGALLTVNAGMIASTADAGQPSSGAGCDGFVYVCQSK